MGTSKDSATKSNPEKKMTDKELDKTSGGHGGHPQPVGGPGTYPDPSTPEQRETPRKA